MNSYLEPLHGDCVIGGDLDGPDPGHLGDLHLLAGHGVTPLEILHLLGWNLFYSSFVPTSRFVAGLPYHHLCGSFAFFLVP